MQLSPAGTWRRFMSAVYESVVLFAVLVFFGYGFSALFQFRGEPGALRWAFQAFLFVVLGCYFVWFWSHGRRTLPMKTVSLTLVGPAGQPISTGRALTRYLWAWIFLVLPVAIAWSMKSGWALWLVPVPFLWSLVDAQRRALYDVLAGTRLVVDPGPSAPAGSPPAPTSKAKL